MTQDTASSHIPPLAEMLTQVQIEVKSFSPAIEVFLSSYLGGMERSLAESIIYNLSGEQYLIDSYQDVLSNGFRIGDTDIGTKEQQVRLYKNNMEAIISIAKQVSYKRGSSSMIEMLIETNDVGDDIGIDEIAEGLYLVNSPYFISIATLMVRFAAKELFTSYKFFIEQAA